MKPFKTIVLFSLAILFAASSTVTAVDAKRVNGPRAKNIIFMVPDGMGLADGTAARIFKFGPDGDRLSFEKLPVIGYQRTHSANSTVTDSAAAASAWASGAKYNNGEISCHDDDFDGLCDGDQGPTLLDMAKASGKSTGGGNIRYHPCHSGSVRCQCSQLQMRRSDRPSVSRSRDRRPARRRHCR